MAHGEEAGGGSRQLADEFSPENPLHAQAGRREQQRQRGDEHDFPQQGEEERITGIVQRDKGGLAGLLQRHERERTEIDPRAADGERDQRLILRKNPDQRFRPEHQDRPQRHIDAQAAEECEADAFRNPVPEAGTVIEAHDVLAAHHDAAVRQADNFPEGIDQAHRADVQGAEYAAPGLQHNVDDGLGDTVGDPEAETGSAELQNSAELPGVHPETGDAKHGFPPAEEQQDPDGADTLGNHGGPGGAADSHSQRVDQQGIQRNVQARTDNDRDHSDLRESLRIDERIHSEADEHRDGAEHIDPEIGQRRRQRFRIPAEQGKDGRRRGVQHDGQESPDQDEHGKGSVDDGFGFLPVPFAPGNGGKRRPAGAEQVREGADQRDERERYAQGRQRQGAALRHMADVHPVHDVVQHMDQLRQHHRQTEAQDDSRNLSPGEITFVSSQENTFPHLNCFLHCSFKSRQRQAGKAG